ncbi:hypothetical protein [Novosphingobium sp. FKTRR1]|uniref:hypothetical protein n=1 Tax=Novosphingobium sp. FKTRR1 TaxID=2879118 RepID=UPI001CF06587|nr:hypothetical protein [Novosphingobium sp. FKTRR1]
MSKRFQIAAFCCLTALAWAPQTACAAPGMGDEVYGATVEKGEVELETTYGRLAGGPDHAEDGTKIELAYSPTARLRIAALTELEREAGGRRKAEEAGVEAIYALGRLGGIDVAIYGEYSFGLNGHADALEGKLLLERRAGKFDARLNLIAEKPLAHGEKLAFDYAASVDYAIAGDELRAGIMAFGELGTTDHFMPRAEHFVGPVLQTEIEGLGPELKIQAGYLFALGKARDDTKGQFRLSLELEL